MTDNNDMWEHYEYEFLVKESDLSERTAKVVDKVAKETGWSRDEVWGVLIEVSALVAARLFDEAFYEAYNRGDCQTPWELPHMFVPVDIDYHHQLPSNKHPWERDGIADME